MSIVEEVTKALCKASGCHHLCSNTEGCVVEEEARAILDKYELVPKELPFMLTKQLQVSEKLLINENKSNNFDVKSNNELFKQALVEGLNRHFDKTIEEAKKIEQIEEMAKVLKDYTKKNNIMASHVILEDYAEQLYKAGFCKREWISVEEMLISIIQDELGWW